MNYAAIKIFMLDDDAFFSKTLEGYLRKHGFVNIHSFQSSAQLFEHVSEKPDVLLLDHFLRLEIGLDVLERVRAEFPKIKVFYLSSQEKAKIAVRALKMGATDYFEKNMVDINNLVAAIEQEFGLSHDVYLDGE